MLKPCATRGCGELVERGQFHCPEHRPAPWVKNYRNPPGERYGIPRKEWERLRRVVIRRAKGLCAHCGRKGRDVDHIIPYAQGGPTVLSNLQLLCTLCHDVKTRAQPRR